MIPIFILHTWLLGLLSLGIVGAAGWLAHEWQQRSWHWDDGLQRSFFHPNLGWNEPTALLVAAVLLALVALFGGSMVRAGLWLLKRKDDKPADDPRIAPVPVKTQTVEAPDGSQLYVALHGPEDGTPLILTHGWGLHSAEWNLTVRALASRYRLIVWDEPGLGSSTRPPQRDYTVENLAHCLSAVLPLAGEKPAFLAGHSIGGMITLTFCRLYPEALRSRVAGLILTHTTPTNPVRTTKGTAFYTAIEKPVLVPLMYLTIALSPLVWLLNWLSYRNGTAHLSTKHGSFAGTEKWSQIEFATQFQPKASPAVLARGMLGMMQYDARAVLPAIQVPTLVVAGDKDSTTKKEASEEMRSTIPGARLVTLKPARHLGLIEHYGEYAKAVSAFVESVLTTARPSPAGALRQ